MKLVQVFGMLLLSSAGAVMANDMTPSGSASTGAEPGTTRQETSTITSSTTSKSMSKSAFDALDTNKDGYLTKMEAEQGGTMNNFTAADHNGDGRLDPDEYAALQQNSSMSSESSMSQSHSVTSNTPSDDQDDQ
jgi:hypothetical protein